MKENVCIDCQYYENCKRPYKVMKCMGYKRKVRQDSEELPVLYKEDRELGYAYFCPHCKKFQCTGKESCTQCGGRINWKKSTPYFGRVKW